MEAVAIELDAISAIGGTSTAPFAEVYVTLIGVGNGARRPLPPNPLCSSPATGAPVSCFRIGIGAPIDGLQTS